MMPTSTPPPTVVGNLSPFYAADAGSSRLFSPGRRVGIKFANFSKQRFGIRAGVGALVEDHGPQLARGAALPEEEDEKG
jgi:hypothetical protein